MHGCHLSCAVWGYVSDSRCMSVPALSIPTEQCRALADVLMQD